MVTAYPVRGKAKSVEICRAFVQGCGGAIAHNPDRLLPGPAFFYGVDASNVHLWNEAFNSDQDDPEQDFYYCDNSYFDATRQSYFRVTRNATQCFGSGSTTGERFAALGIPIKPWRERGEHIVVCPQSAHFMHTIAFYDGDWLADTKRALAAATKRPLRVRHWSPDKAALAATLEDDLVGAHLLVTWSSAAAITAILSGVPVITTGQSAAVTMGARMVDEYRVEYPPMPDGRERWAGILADNQWTLDEMRNGKCWRDLNGE